MATTTEQSEAGHGQGPSGATRPVALVTGVGRTVGIGAGIASQLAESGWDIAFNYWTPYDERMTWGVESEAVNGVQRTLVGHGAATVAIEADLSRTNTPAQIFDRAEQRLGASKGALERITLAAARELAHLGITANVINPGPVDTGWMSDEIRAAGTSQTPLGRLGMPQDTGHLVDFLCSPQGGWINGQLLMSNGGFA